MASCCTVCFPSLGKIPQGICSCKLAATIVPTTTPTTMSIQEKQRNTLRNQQCAASKEKERQVNLLEKIIVALHEHFDNFHYTQRIHILCLAKHYILKKNELMSDIDFSKLKEMYYEFRQGEENNQLSIDAIGDKTQDIILPPSQNERQKCPYCSQKVE